jgi:hypothetical protein
MKMSKALTTGRKQVGILPEIPEEVRPNAP